MTENVAAAGIKGQLRRHASNPRVQTTHSTSQGNGGPTEHTSLIHEWSHNDSGAPLRKDSRWWVGGPWNALYLAYKTIGSNYVNFLLVFVPLGIIAGAAHWSPTAVFILNFLAIIPLASLLSFATEELSVKLGQTLGGLLNATFGNAVELIVSLAVLGRWRIANGGQGQHCRVEKWRNSNSSVQHVGVDPLQHPLGSGLLLPSRRH